ncbi:radical SAM protein [bacterium]|nr:MAG: radical SAM protein [bacterium]
MKTLLLNPPPKEIIEPYDAPDYPHIGFGYIASYLRSKDCPVTVFDAKLERMGVADTLEMINDIKPNIIGLSAYTQEINHVALLAQKIKKRYPGIITVIGGIHATALPLETLQEFLSFDFLIFGEGEITLYELIEALKNNRPLTHIKGLGFRSNDKIYINEHREWIFELDKLPFPAWDLFPRVEQYPIISSRGCPFKCIFCTRPLGNKVRERSPENVMAELKGLVIKYNAKSIIFRDETFGVNKKRAMRIADMIIEENINEHLRWDMHSRVDVVDYEFLDKMKCAGCVHVGFGVESGNANVLKMSKKGITLEQAKKAVEISRELGLETSSYFILGLPHETNKTAWNTINFARKLNTDTVSIAIMIPFPGTEIAEMVKSGEGGYKQISYKWTDYNKQLGAVVELKTITRKQLVLFQVCGYLIFYICNFRFGFLYNILKSRFRQVLIMMRNLLRIT